MRRENKPLGMSPRQIRWREDGRRRRIALKREFGDKCEVCGHVQRRLEFHHLSYPNGIRIPMSVTMLAKAVKADPTNFRLLCRMCHEAVTRLSHPIFGPKIQAIVNLTLPCRIRGSV